MFSFAWLIFSFDNMSSRISYFSASNNFNPFFPLKKKGLKIIWVIFIFFKCFPNIWSVYNFSLSLLVLRHKYSVNWEFSLLSLKTNIHLYVYRYLILQKHCIRDTMLPRSTTIFLLNQNCWENHFQMSYNSFSMIFYVAQNILYYTD